LTDARNRIAPTWITYESVPKNCKRLLRRSKLLVAFRAGVAAERLIGKDIPRRTPGRDATFASLMH